MTTTAAGPTPGPTVPPPIDPRIRARRIEVARDTGRRRLRRLAAVVAAMGAVAVGWGLTQSPLLDVDAVAVEGAARTGERAVVDATGIVAGTPMVGLDLAAAERAVATLPWVAEVSVRRSWPGTVRVALEEWAPAGALPVPDGADVWMLVSAGGHLLERVVELPAGVLVVEGLGRPGEPGTLLPTAEAPLRVATAVPEVLTPRLRAVRVARSGELEVVVAADDGAVEAGGTEVVARLGPPVDLEEKLVALATVVDHADLGGSPLIDVRVPTSPVLTHPETRG